MIPQAGWSCDGENDLVANVISLGVIAVHSLAIYLDLDTVVCCLIDLRHHCPVPVFRNIQVIKPRIYSCSQKDNTAAS